ncbi:hypothetical protein VPH35_083047 [Triticum aestivum]
MIEGVPSHVWTRDTAAELLGLGCLVESLAPETASREDLSLFKLRAWCIDPDEVPVARRLWVPEPEVEFNPAARRPTSRQLLEYKTLIHIGRVREHAGPEGWLRPPSSDGSGQSVLPEDSDSFSGSGEWRVLPWTRGVRDVRANAPAGGVAGGAYRHALLGHVGPSDWRILPIMVGARVAVSSKLGIPTSPAVRPSAPAPVSPVAAVGPVLGRQEEPVEPGRLAAENPVVATLGQDLVVAEGPRSPSHRPNQPPPPPIGVQDVVTKDVVVGSMDPMVVAFGRQEMSIGAALGQGVGIVKDSVWSTPLESEPANAETVEAEVAATTDATGPVGQNLGDLTAMETGQRSPTVGVGPAREAQGLAGSLDQETALGWDPMEELLPLTITPAEVGIAGPANDYDRRLGEVGCETTNCTVGPRLMDRAACMDVDVRMHVPLAPNDVLLPPKEQIVVANIKAFCAGLLKKLASLLLMEIEAVRGKNAGPEYTPRHNTRSAYVNVPRKTKATAAETVLLKALGISPEGLAVTDEALGQLRQMFDSPIQEPQLRAIASIFGKAIPLDLGQEDTPRVTLLA